MNEDRSNRRGDSEVLGEELLFRSFQCVVLT